MKSMEHLRVGDKKKRKHTNMPKHIPNTLHRPDTSSPCLGIELFWCWGPQRATATLVLLEFRDRFVSWWANMKVFIIWGFWKSLPVVAGRFDKGFEKSKPVIESIPADLQYFTVALGCLHTVISSDSEWLCGCPIDLGPSCPRNALTCGSSCERLCLLAAWDHLDKQSNQEIQQPPVRLESELWGQLS